MPKGMDTEAALLPAMDMLTALGADTAQIADLESIMATVMAAGTDLATKTNAGTGVDADTVPAVSMAQAAATNVAVDGVKQSFK